MYAMSLPVRRTSYTFPSAPFIVTISKYTSGPPSINIPHSHPSHSPAAFSGVNSPGFLRYISWLVVPPKVPTWNLYTKNNVVHQYKQIRKTLIYESTVIGLDLMYIPCSYAIQETISIYVFPYSPVVCPVLGIGWFMTFWCNIPRSHSIFNVINFKLAKFLTWRNKSTWLQYPVETWYLYLTKNVIVNGSNQTF